MHCKRFGSNFGLHPLDGKATPSSSCDNRKYLLGDIAVQAQKQRPRGLGVKGSTGDETGGGHLWWGVVIEASTK